jgi:hypothetical protein
MLAVILKQHGELAPQMIRSAVLVERLGVDDPSGRPRRCDTADTTLKSIVIFLHDVQDSVDSLHEHVVRGRAGFVISAAGRPERSNAKRAPVAGQGRVADLNLRPLRNPRPRLRT